MEVDTQLLKAVELCRENGLGEAANRIAATIPFKEVEFIFRLSKRLHQQTGDLEYCVEACYAEENKTAIHPRKFLTFPARDTEPHEIAFYICVQSLMKDICEERVAAIRNAKSGGSV